MLNVTVIKMNEKDKINLMKEISKDVTIQFTPILIIWVLGVICIAFSIITLNPTLSILGVFFGLIATTWSILLALTY